MNQILIVEDEPVIRNALKRLLERNDYRVTEVGSVDEAEAALSQQTFQLVISDLRLPGRPGTDVIALAAPAPVLIMTSYASMRSAVDAMKQGAADYIAKPFDHEEMLNTVAAQLTKSGCADADSQPKPNPAPSREEGDFSMMAGNSAPMQELFSRISKVARTDATVLIQGESGTGKELAARAIHQHSRRAEAPMISVNCAAIPDTLIESELFGHEKGAFTGAVNTHRGLIEAANGGTLFLDEIGELPLDAQARLLRVLQEGEIRRVGSVQPMQVDIRLIAATHRDLKALTRAGRFREDLFYRLYIMEIRMPPLRERGSDIIELAELFLRKACERMATPPRRLAATARNAMLHHRWPGNVRELENAIERAVILCEAEEIGADILGLDPEHHAAPITADQPPGDYGRQAPSSPALSLEDYFQRFVQEHQDHMTETELAKRLGISRKTLWERRQKLGIPRPGRDT
ncbi:sigma-54-dependent transcriptional regulator [Motiliproteus sediminis]|uniref:sigma-54-dependent transcriptional regulator n=1 Tax=Motiliproteus sediminis TaxID=1468178 RepID=UPI001AEFC94A|nr:sigma-54 dependent transcriptional regulator [Motiliproteus sediminis]